MSWRDFITYLDPEAEDITPEMMDALEGTRIKVGGRMLTFDEAWQAIDAGVEISRDELSAMPYAYEMILSIQSSIVGSRNGRTYTLDEVEDHFRKKFSVTQVAL